MASNAGGGVMAGIEVDRGFVLGARRILASKLAMQSSLPSNYIYDPAVAILLELFIARADGTRFSLRTLCEIIRYVPASNVSRWVKVIHSDGLLTTSDPAHGDSVVALTEHGAEVVRTMIVAVGKAEKQVRDDGAVASTISQNLSGAKFNQGY